MIENTIPIVYVVDDDKAMRESVSWLVRSVNLSVETCTSARDFFDRYDSEKPGCLILDIRLPGMSGLELQDRLIEQGIDIPIIVITGHGDVPMAVRALKSGALDFLEKPFNDQKLLDRVRQAVDTDLAKQAERAKTREITRRFLQLTPREHDVACGVIAGKSSKMIAFELNLSAKTVESYRAQVMNKLQANSVPHLVQMAIAAESAGIDCRLNS